MTSHTAPKPDEAMSLGGHEATGPRSAQSEAEIRRDLAAAYRVIAMKGMDDGIYTHISARLPDGPSGQKRFLLNPFGMSFDEVTAGNLVTVDESGAILDDPHGYGVNAAGFTIHSAVHMARHDAACVLHTHTVAGVAVSSVKEGLLSLNQWSAQFHGAIGYHDYEGIALDLEERERIIADLGGFAHTLLVGAELSRHETENCRETGVFNVAGTQKNTFVTPQSSIYQGPVVFRHGATDADNDALTYALATGPANGTVVVNANGTGLRRLGEGSLPVWISADQGYITDVLQRSWGEIKAEQ